MSVRCPKCGEGNIDIVVLKRSIKAKCVDCGNRGPRDTFESEEAG